jgi:ferric-dicitrate binding protein FerR (iron transport regulator)
MNLGRMPGRAASDGAHRPAHRELHAPFRHAQRLADRRPGLITGAADDDPSGLTRRHRVLGWCATAVMAAAVVAMLVTM